MRKFFKLPMLQVSEAAFPCSLNLGSISHILCVITGGAGAWLALSPCPFYPEGGGQAADTGHVTFIHDGQRVCAAVRDCKKVYHALSSAGCVISHSLPRQVSDSCVVISVANPLPSLLLSDCLPHGSVVCAEVDGSKRRYSLMVVLLGC
jgi:hypothetical protein